MFSPLFSISLVAAAPPPARPHPDGCLHPPELCPFPSPRPLRWFLVGCSQQSFQFLWSPPPNGPPVPRLLRQPPQNPDLLHRPRLPQSRRRSPTSCFPGRLG